MKGNGWRMENKQKIIKFNFPISIQICLLNEMMIVLNPVLVDSSVLSTNRQMLFRATNPSHPPRARGKSLATCVRIGRCYSSRRARQMRARDRADRARRCHRGCSAPGARSRPHVAIRRLSGDASRRPGGWGTPPVESPSKRPKAVAGGATWMCRWKSS